MVWLMKSDVSRLVLGTELIGSRHGAAPRPGSPAVERAVRLLRRAHRAGIAAFDADHAQGEAELRIGDAFDGDDQPATFTVLDLGTTPDDASAGEAEVAVEASVSASLVNMKRARLDTLMLRARHLTSHDGAVWSRVLRLQKAGVIAKIGVAVQTPEEAFEALGRRAVTHIQLPLNLLDQRWRETGVPDACRARPDVTVHACNIYLRGILAAEDSYYWPRVHGVDAEGTLYMLDTLSRLFNRMSISDLCLAYVRGQDWVHGFVIGMENEEQLDRNLALLDAPAMTADEIANIEPRLPRFPLELLDPALWPVKES